MDNIVVIMDQIVLYLSVRKECRISLGVTSLLTSDLQVIRYIDSRNFPLLLLCFYYFA